MNQGESTNKVNNNWSINLIVLNKIISKLKKRNLRRQSN